MRKLLVGCTLLAISAFTGSAAPVLAPPVAQCTALGGGLRSDISIPYLVWTNPGFACENQDKIFSNFVAGSGVPTDTTLQLQEQTVGPFDIHVVTFNANFTTAFTLSYDIAVDLTQLGGLNRIVRVSGDLSNPSNIGNPATAKAVFTEGGVQLGTVTSTVPNPGTPLIVSETALHIVDAYLPNGGAAVSVSNTFAQQQIPEPATLMLMGSALMLLSRFKRSH